MSARKVSAMALSILLLSALSAGQAVRSQMLVSTGWLAEHLEDPAVVVLHVTKERATYDQGHIPGARFLAIADLAVEREGNSNEMPPAQELVRTLEGLGVGDHTRVVLYGDVQGLWAARAYVALDYLGHGDHAALLDGGLEKWKSEARPISTTAPSIEAGRLTPRPRPETLVPLPAVRDFSFVATQVEPANVVLIDARPPAQYAGKEGYEADPRQGHIPGAASLFWVETIASRENPVLRPTEEIRRLYEAAGAGPGKKVVTYCRSGVQASHAYFTAKYLGYDVALYDGSWAEWSRTQELPVATAPAKP